MGGERTFDAQGDVPLVDRYRVCPSEELASAFAELGGTERAIMAQRLAMLAVLDEREAWVADGCRDAAAWVAATDAVRRRTGRAYATVAAALPGLPAIAAAVEAGRLSFDQLVPLCELATADTDERWAAEGPGLDPGQLAARAAKQNRVAREREEEAHRARSVRAWAARGGGMRGSFFLPHADAAAFLEGLDRLATTYSPPAGDDWEPLHARRADALVDLAWLALGGPGGSGSAHLYVHAAAGVVGEDGDGWATLADGTAIARSTLERLGCDASTQLVLHDPTGAFVAISTRVHDVPRRIRRLLVARDRCCRFPGCGSTIGLHAHHLRFWSRQGPTEPANLALLCHRHHRLVHEGGWTLTGDPDTDNGLRFTRPDGRPLDVAPAPCTDRVREHLVPDPPPPPDDVEADDDDDADAERRRILCCDRTLRAIRTRLRRQHLRDLADNAP